MHQELGGTVVGTGAAINVPLGFAPDFIEVANITDGTATWRWYGGMTAATAMKQDNTLVAANGLSLDPGDTTRGIGFTIGSALSLAGKTLAYRAVRYSI